jgi:hypothetical protein
MKEVIAEMISEMNQPSVESLWQALPAREKWRLHYRQMRVSLDRAKQAGRNRGWFPGGEFIVQIDPPCVIEATGRWSRPFAEAALAARV